MVNAQYLAGFFDADGSVGIYKRGNGWQVTISVANSGKHGRIICNALVKQFGGTVTVAKKKKKTHRDVFWFKASGTDIGKAFLEYIKDYSIIKKDQIELVLEFIDKKRMMPRYKKTPEQIQYLIDCCKKCKEMKREC